MEIQEILKDSHFNDGTWDVAKQIVQERINLPYAFLQLIRNAWNDELSQSEFLRLVSFSGANPSCLFNVADIQIKEDTPVHEQAELLEKAIEKLGIRFSIFVLAVNVCVRKILSNKPPSGWRKLLESMMKDIHIGCCFGTFTSEMGKEGGGLVGFARTIGLGILMANNPKSFRSYLDMKRQLLDVSHEKMIDLFQCEPYQVSAILLQYLGFGISSAVGAICGLSKLNTEHLNFNYADNKWRAAFAWIDALREGRDYPAEVELRNAFPAIRPPKNRNTSNPVLEMLYVDVARIRQKGSPWMWHLPKPDYNKTKEMFNL